MNDFKEEKEKWKNFRSFFISISGEIELDFSDEAKIFAPLGVGNLKMTKDIAAIFAKIKRFDPIIN